MAGSSVTPPLALTICTSARLVARNPARDAGGLRAIDVARAMNANDVGALLSV
jgi:hypothetical protein